MPKYGKLAQRKVRQAVKEYKAGELKSGKFGAPVKSLKQAVAIGLSKARRQGAKMPAFPRG